MLLQKLKKLHALRLASRKSVTHRSLGKQLGMTLLEIMIVLAIIAVVMGFLVGPKVLGMFQSSKVDTTRMIVKKIAFEAYSQWSLDNSDKSCPASLKDLQKYRNSKSIKDGWGHKMVMLCGDSAPEGAVSGFGILSLGKDGKRDTKDDIKSWED